MERSHIRILLLLVVTACLLCSFHSADGALAILLDATVLLSAIVATWVAMRNRYYMSMTICGILSLLWAGGLILELRTGALGLRKMKITLCAAGDVIRVDGKEVDCEGYRGVALKDFARYGVARTAELFFEPGCSASNLFALCEMDVDMSLSRDFLLGAKAGRTMFRYFRTYEFNQMPGNDILLFAVEPGGKVGNRFYRLKSSAIPQLLEWAAKCKIGHSCSTPPNGASAETKVYSIEELHAIKNLHRFDMVLALYPTMKLQKLCALLHDVAALCPCERILITPLVQDFKHLNSLDDSARSMSEGEIGRAPAKKPRKNDDAF